MNRRLGAYRQLETDPLIDAELQRIIRSGLVDRRRRCRSCRPAPEPAASEAGRAGATTGVASGPPAEGFRGSRSVNWRSSCIPRVKRRPGDRSSVIPCVERKG